MEEDNKMMPPPSMMPPPVAPAKRSTPTKKKEDNTNTTTTTTTTTTTSTENTETTPEPTNGESTPKPESMEPPQEKGKEKWKEPEKVDLLYEPPEWSSAPKHEFHFEVLKNGTIVEKIDLSKKEHFLIGRLPVCDITYDHSSVSRQHAVIQNRDTGALYIYDLGSTHKTVVNKRPVPPKVHYVLRIGDVVKIGQSTRLLIVCGPEEVQKEQREALERHRAEYLRKKMEDQVQIKTYTPLIDLFAKKDTPSTIASMRSDSASWGMDFDDDAVYAGDDPEAEVFVGNEDDAEAYLKKEKREAKKLAGQNKKGVKYVDEDDDSGDDEFFDRTKQKSEFGASGKVETYETLVSRKEELDKAKQDLEKELKSVRNEDFSTSNAEDSLDAFMSSNSESIVGDKRKRLREKLAEVEKEQTKLERLIKLAAPALKPMPAVKKAAATPAPAAPAPGAGAATSAAVPAKPAASILKADAPVKRVLQKLDAEIPEEYRVKEKEPSPPSSPAQEDGEEAGEEGQPDKKEKKESNTKDAGGDKKKSVTWGENEEKGEKEGEEDGEKKSRTAIKRERQREKQKQKSEDEKKKRKLEEFEEKYEAWVPPTAQSGDGRTKLNDLYGY